jgi:hypothetical protein
MPFPHVVGIPQKHKGAIIVGIISWSRRSLAVGGVTAVAAIAVAGCGGGAAGSPASQIVKVATSKRASDTDLAEAGRKARSQARRYERTAVRIGRLHVDASLDGPRLRLLASLRQAATAYQVAGAAADSADVAAYSAALVAAGESRRSVQQALSDFRVRASAPMAGALAGKGAKNGSTAPARPCAGDSVSDDPSDDSCNP